MAVRRATVPSARPRARIVIAGAGVGGCEAALALSALAGDRVALTLITPERDFVYRPVAVLAPFVGAGPKRVSVAEVAAEVRAELVRDAVTALDPARHTVITAGGHTVHYDQCIVAIGARTRPPGPGQTPIDLAQPTVALAPVLAAIEAGTVARLAIVVPRPSWPLAPYELALLTRRRAREAGRAPRIALEVEGRPLAGFGHAVSQAVGALLAEAEIELRPAAGWKADRVLAVPALRGPGLPGLPGDEDGFVPVGTDGSVTGLADVYAVGDATDFPLKFGGIAALHADAAAMRIGAGLGLVAAPRPCEGIVPAVMLTGGEPGELHFALRIEDGAVAEVGLGPSPGRWAQDAKLGARYLGAYLDERWARGPAWRHAARARWPGGPGPVESPPDGGL